MGGANVVSGARPRYTIVPSLQIIKARPGVVSLHLPHMAMGPRVGVSRLRISLATPGRSPASPASLRAPPPSSASPARRDACRSGAGPDVDAVAEATSPAKAPSWPSKAPSSSDAAVVRPSPQTAGSDV